MSSNSNSSSDGGDREASSRQLEIHRLIDEHGLDTFDKVRAFFSAEPYHFRVGDDPDKNVYLLKYHQIKTCFRQRASHEARGIILCKETNKVVCYPFDKFFNAGERHAAKVDWSSAEVQHKYDGSIIKLYYHNDAWNVATNGTTDARNAASSSGRTFYELFQEAAERAGLDVERLDKRCTYMFELMHPESLIVVRYDEPRLVHIGTRHNETYEESYEYIGVDQVETFPLNTLAACREAAMALGPSQEGYVVRDAAWRRVKIKGPVYVKLHHTLTSNHLSEEEVAAQMILQGEESEVSAYDTDKRIAAICEHIGALKKRLYAVVDRLVRIWCEVALDDKKNTSRKAMVAEFKKYPAQFFSFFMSRCKHEAKATAGKGKKEPYHTFFKRLVLEHFAKEKLTRSDTRDFLAFLTTKE